jgi:hypothetical protein
MKALIKTKTNFRNLNGTWLPVHQIVGNRVTCIIEDELAYNGELKCDFTMKEISEFRYNEK